MKPLLIINCSNKKNNDPKNGFELYASSASQMLNSHLDNPLDHFEILILSAEYGLIDGKASAPPHYNTEMPMRDEDIKAYAEKNKAKSLRLFRSFKDKGRDCYIIMTKRYMKAFDYMFKSEKHQVEDFNRFNSVYTLRSQRGSGDLRGAMNRAISTTISPVDVNPIYFRSGISNLEELAYIAAGCDFGGSLYHNNTKKGTGLLSVMLDNAKHSRFFLDNGLKTAFSKGKTLDPDYIMNEYKTILSATKGKQMKNISIVVPDAPHCAEAALDILRRHKRDIKALSKRCDVIVPIHKCDDIRQQAFDMMKILDYAPVRFGIPCLKGKGLDLRLPLKDIDAILTLKKPNTENRLINKVHMFGLSESSNLPAYRQRIKLIQMHGLCGDNVSLDAQRTTAMFGKTKTGLRQGSKAEQELVSEHKQKQIVASDEFVSHNYESEYGGYDSQRICTEDFWELLLCEDTALEWFEIYNEIMAKESPYLLVDVDSLKGKELDELSEYAHQLTGHRTIEESIIKFFKERLWENFESRVKNLKAMKFFERRFESVKRVYREGNPAPEIQVQLPLALQI